MLKCALFFILPNIKESVHYLTTKEVLKCALFFILPNIKESVHYLTTKEIFKGGIYHTLCALEVGIVFCKLV